MTNSENRSITAPKQLVAEQVNAMLSHLETVHPGLRAQLFENAISTLSARTDIDLRLVGNLEVDSSLCSVAGVYLADHDPPVLAVSESTSIGRRAFTALHEFGHHLQQSVFELMERPMDQPDGGLVLEDAACDSFASSILLPLNVIDQHIEESGPTAESIRSLWQAVEQVSRAAVCVRASSFLKSPGHITLFDYSGTVLFSTTRDLPPLRRGSDQSNVSIVKAALRSPDRLVQGEAEFSYRDGIRGQKLYSQATHLDGVVIAVSVTERAPWLKLSLPRRDNAPKGVFRICEHNSCSYEFRTFNRPCTQCGVPACPECGQCNCILRIRERLCTSCYLVRAVHFFQGDNSRCADCS